MTRPPTAHRDRWCAVGLAVVTLVYLVAGRGYPLDTLATPGPGLFPLATGLALLALAAWQFVVARPGPSVSAAAPHAHAPWLMSAVLVVYAAALPVIGFALDSFGLVFVASRLMGLGGAWRPAALALGVTLASRVIFVTWLHVPLP